MRAVVTYLLVTGILPKAPTIPPNWEQEGQSCAAFDIRNTDGATDGSNLAPTIAPVVTRKENRGCFAILQHPKSRDKPYLRHHQKQCQPQHVRHRLHGLERENKGTRAHRNQCSPLKRPPRRPRSSTNYRDDAKEVPLDITQKRHLGLRAFLRVPKVQEVYQPASRHAASPLPPIMGSPRDGHPRHGSELRSWEQTSPCCSGQSQQISVRLSTTQQDRGECGQETSRIAVNTRDTHVSAQRPRHGVHRRGCPELCKWLNVTIDYGPTDHPRAQEAVEGLGGWTHEALVELCKSWPRWWDEYVQSVI